MGSQCMFSLRNKKKLSLDYPQYPLLSGVLELTSIEGVVTQGSKQEVTKVIENEMIELLAMNV